MWHVACGMWHAGGIGNVNMFSVENPDTTWTTQD